MCFSWRKFRSQNIACEHILLVTSWKSLKFSKNIVKQLCLSSKANLRCLTNNVWSFWKGLRPTISVIIVFSRRYVRWSSNLQQRWLQFLLHGFCVFASLFQAFVNTARKTSKHGRTIITVKCFYTFWPNRPWRFRIRDRQENDRNVTFLLTSSTRETVLWTVLKLW